MSLRMRLQTLVQTLPQFRFSHPPGYLCGVDRAPGALWVRLLSPECPPSLFLPLAGHKPTPLVELGSICLVCMLPKGCADHETCSSLPFALALKHLELNTWTPLLSLTTLGESLNAQQNSDAALEGLCYPC